MVWPTLEQYTEDAYALDFLAQLLSDGKKAPMYKMLVKEKELTSRVSAYNNSQELAGEFHVVVTANSGKNLAEVETAILESFQKFEDRFRANYTSVFRPHATPLPSSLATLRNH